MWWDRWSQRAFSAIRKGQRSMPSITTRSKLSFFKRPMISVLLNKWLRCVAYSSIIFKWFVNEFPWKKKSERYLIFTGSVNLKTHTRILAREKKALLAATSPLCYSCLRLFCSTYWCFYYLQLHYAISCFCLRYNSFWCSEGSCFLPSFFLPLILHIFRFLSCSGRC